MFQFLLRPLHQSTFYLIPPSVHKRQTSFALAEPLAVLPIREPPVPEAALHPGQDGPAQVRRQGTDAEGGTE